MTPADRSRSELIRALKAHARKLVEDLEDQLQPVHPYAAAERALISYAPVPGLPLGVRDGLISDLEEFVRDLRATDKHV